MLGTFWEHLETKTASQISEKRFSVPPTGIEPISPEPESAILSIELQGQPLNEIAKVQLFWIYYKFFHRFFMAGQEKSRLKHRRIAPNRCRFCCAASVHEPAKWWMQ